MTLTFLKGYSTNCVDISYLAVVAECGNVQDGWCGGQRVIGAETDFN